MSQAGPIYGKLIGASLGPGDPELITRRAWAVLQSGARWLYPVKKAEESSYALSIVERGGIPIPLGAVELFCPMTRDAVILAKAWVRAAEQTVALLAEGRDLAFLVEGDASTFATFGHLARVVRELVPQIEVETIPGVSSFAAAAASTGTTLAEEDETFAIIPAAYVLPAPIRSFSGCGIDGLRWEIISATIERVILPTKGCSKLQVVRFKAGSTIPKHDHRGSEMTLILSGSIRDRGQLLRRGDTAVCEPGHIHTPKVGDAEDCLCLVMTQAPLRLCGLVSRWLGRLAGF